MVLSVLQHELPLEQLWDSIAPGPGTIVGSGIGLVVGYLGTVAGNTFYDNSVNRRNGDDMWGHIKDNLW